MRISLCVVFSIFLFTSPLYAEERTAQDCYEQNDQACLKSLFSDIFDENPSPDSINAIYLLGLLKLDKEKDLVAAKDTFMMAVMFGDGHKKSQNKMRDLYKTDPDMFETTDCVAIESQECLLNISENGTGNEPRNAQYLMGTMLFKDDPEQGLEYFNKAAASGHTTAACILQDLYSSDEDGVDMDYNLSVEWGFKCPSKPFKNFSDKFYKRYQAESGHKAYAHSDSGAAFYSRDKTTADAAARVALELCMSHNTNQEKYPCRVINVNSEWVKDFEPGVLPETVTGLEQIFSKKGYESFSDYSSRDATNKVFTYSTSTIWWWVANSTDSLDKMRSDALNKCRDINKRLESKFPCRIVHENGVWVEQ